MAKYYSVISLYHISSSTHQWMAIWVISTFRPSRVVPPRAFVCKFLCEHVSLLLNKLATCFIFSFCLTLYSAEMVFCDPRFIHIVAKQWLAYLYSWVIYHYVKISIPYLSNLPLMDFVQFGVVMRTVAVGVLGRVPIAIRRAQGWSGCVTVHM